LEEIVSFVVDEDEGGKIFDADLPDRFHAEFGVFEDFEGLDVIGGEEKHGAVVVLDPRNGDVLALVSRPAFDPNSFAGGIDSASWKRLAESEGRPLQNRALAGQYPPASTYKVFVAAAGLEEGAIDPEERVFCPGTFKLGRRTYRCWKRGGHGSVNLHEALARSCDVFFYQLGLKLGIDRMAFFANGFHLGRRTGIALGNEAAGLVPTRAWKERHVGEVWLKGETVSASIGQGFNLTTPMQLAVAYAAIANGGKLVRPRLVLRTEDLRGSGLSRHAHTAGLEDDEITFRQRDHAWFVAYAPADAPEIVVVAILEHGGHGGSAAAPVVQRVLAAYFGEDETPPVPSVAVVPSVASGTIMSPVPSVAQGPEPRIVDTRVAALTLEGAGLVRD